MVDALGNVPGDFMNSGFLMLKPFQLMAQKYVGFVSVLDKEQSLRSFMRMEKWIFDSPDQAGEAFRQFIKDFYQQNKLIKGEVMLGDQRVDLKRITMPILNVYATEDHLVPPSSSEALPGAVGIEGRDHHAVPRWPHRHLRQQQGAEGTRSGLGQLGEGPRGLEPPAESGAREEPGRPASFPPGVPRASVRRSWALPW